MAFVATLALTVEFDTFVYPVADPTSPLLNVIVLPEVVTLTIALPEPFSVNVYDVPSMLPFLNDTILLTVLMLTSVITLPEPILVKLYISGNFVLLPDILILLLSSNDNSTPDTYSLSVVDIVRLSPKDARLVLLSIISFI